jgi:hypothetical protein
MKAMSLVIPTYRLRDVADTVNEYAAALKQYGHDEPIFVFDDSDEETYRRDFGLFCHKANAANVQYVGPPEKARFAEELRSRVDARHRPHLPRALKPSYGGKRYQTCRADAEARFSSDALARAYGSPYERVSRPSAFLAADGR